MTDVRLIQVARIYGLRRDEVTEESASAALRDDPERLANALFEEATASDDVISEETALEYIEGRFAFLGDLVGEDVRAMVKGRFREQLLEWLKPASPGN